MADGHLLFDTKVDEKGFNQGINKLKGLAKTGTAVVGAAVAAGVAGFGAITKASLDSVASLEQNIGGIQTLFKNSSDTVINNAKRAYETAGMSANDYMSIVTSFSASLLQSLGQDTEKAVSYADRAVTDMSDNANKMGTSMEMIQNAYQGFAKQNYTMLDNLKLGYGGTQEEMKRLIKDAAGMKDIQEELGVTVDETSMSFGNIVNAISVMQSKMGIAGATAEEAMTTIEGSVNAAKAAFDNLLNGTISADDFADTFVIAADNIIRNISEIVPRLAETLPAVAKSIYEHFSASFENIGPVGLNIVQSILTNIIENAPRMIESGTTMLGNFISGISSRLPELVPLAVSAILSFISGLASNAPMLLSMGADLLLSLANGIADALPIIIEQAPRIINDFCDELYSKLPLLVITGLGIILSLVEGIISSIPTVIKNAGQILKAIVNVFTLANLFTAGAGLIKGLGKGIKSMGGNILKAAKDIVTKVKNPFKIDWSGIGTNIIKGIVNGLKNGVSTIVSAAKNVAKSALDAAKNFLGIHSPSRVFQDQIGKMMALGIGVGFEKNIPIRSMNSKLQTAVNDLKKDVVISTSAMPGRTVGGIKGMPGFDAGGKTDWDEWERRQRKLNKERDSRPIFLGTNRLDRPLPKGAVPAL